MRAQSLSRKSAGGKTQGKLGMDEVAKAVLIVHLSDMHIANGSSEAIARLKSIAGVIGSRIEEPTFVVLAITGDIAYSGKQSEYDLATGAIDILVSELRRWNPTDILVVPSPGNHDCDFSIMAEGVRDAMIEALSKPGSDSASFINVLQPAQSAFATFSTAISQNRLVPESPLVSRVNIDLPNLTIKILTLNTAITSKLHESPGTLRLPSDLLPQITPDADYCIILAHHPLNWFDPHDAIALSEWMDRTADLVFYGHEHRLDQFIQARERTQSRVAYDIGLPLEDPEGVQIGLQCRRIVSATREESVFEIELHGRDCQIVHESSATLERNRGRDHGYIRFSESFVNFLDDPGAAFNHPRVNRRVRLSDFFVAQDFREFTTKRAIVAQSARVGLNDICEHLLSNKKRSVIYGPEQCGKTTFAKHFIRHSRSKDLTPFYLDGSGLRSTVRGEIRGWLNGAIKRQFQNDCESAVDSVAPSERVAIVDNVHMLPGGQEGIGVVLEFVAAKCEKIVLLTADDPALSLLSAGTSGEDHAYWKGCEIFELLPLGHAHRGELIRRWVSLGRNVVDEAVAIETEVRQVKALLDRVLGRDSLPKYPMFVLMLLQQLEGMKENRTVAANGSHGYLFEALITQAIDRHVRSHEIGTVNDYLAAIAYDLWHRDSSTLSRSELDNITRKFLAGLVSIDAERLLTELDFACILSIHDDMVGFRYKYVYYYYLAKWICGNTFREASDALLDDLCSLVHTELASNVLMFVAHLQQEQRVICRLLPQVGGLYEEQKANLGNLETYSALSVRFRTAEERAILLDGEARLVSDRTHEFQDGGESGSAAEKDQRDIDDGLRLNSTLKSIATLGQILKSRAASLSPESKIEIAETIIFVARRLMAFLYKVTEDNATDIVRLVSDAFERAFKLDKQEAVDAANALIGTLVVAIANICVARAADAIGSAELSPLLDRLASGTTDADSRLILLVARICGERGYPKELVEDFVNALKPANVLPVSVLGHAVARRFYLDPPNRALRDSACRLLGIDVRPVGERTVDRHR